MKIRIAEMDGDVNIHRDNPRSWNMSLSTMTILLAFIFGLMVLPNDAFARDKNQKFSNQSRSLKFGSNQGGGIHQFGNRSRSLQFGNDQGWGIDKFGNQTWNWRNKNLKNNVW